MGSQRNKIVEGWKTARIFPIHKEGDEDEVKNYREVALLDSGYKLYALILTKRLKGWLEENNKLGESQAGFRERRDTRDHVFVLNSLINNRLKRKNGKLYACFVDHKKAFNSVDRRVLKKKMKKIGLKGKFLRAIDKIYQETLNEIITGEGISEKFRTKIAVKQGCPRNVLLFLIQLEKLEER